ncbi:nicotinamide mononucleotide permease [Diaporthe amygdali]|uniref:nicotinamide mononucleotide permease n=1 Tax=Phomopsis amygdali TaxID=1214568 RepID=UPI0022FF1610|nr:nicotinamide mononucleotide permease [Diaporthe amygdali]KAJ0118222.1 nicotinamide mononucleotide permease [Diaporthe amygdali]
MRTTSRKTPLIHFAGCQSSLRLGTFEFACDQSASTELKNSNRPLRRSLIPIGNIVVSQIFNSVITTSAIIATRSPNPNEKDESHIASARRSTIDSASTESTIEIDGFRVLGLSSNDADFYDNFSTERRKRILRKVDIRLVPVLTILYLIAHIDRANIGNAKIEGLIEDLGLSGAQYNVSLAIFFFPYILFMLPSNILLKRFRRPSLYIGTLISVWGAVMTCTGLVNTFSQLVAVRSLLGLFEAGFFPGAVYICSRWYMPRDLASRVSYFYFEGIATVFLGAATIVLLVDSPSLSKRWLNEEEIRFLELQVFIKQGGKLQGAQEEKARTWPEVKNVLTNWRVYVHGSFLIVNSSCSYGLKFTLPTITKAMGFSNTKAQFLSAPPYVAGAISALICGRLSDRLNWRMPFIVVPGAFILVGYSILLSLNGAISSNAGSVWAAIVIAMMGIYPIQPTTQAWNANNITPASRRAVGVGLTNAVGNVGGIVGSFMYVESQAMRYETGFGLSLALGAYAMLMALFLEWSYTVSNARKAKEIGSRPYNDAELLAMGDKSPLFRHVLLGGTWAKERLYPGLKTNNLVGTLQYPDFPLVPEEFGIERGQHIPGHIIHEYLSRYAEKFEIASKIRLQHKVISAEHRDEGGWKMVAEAEGRIIKITAARLVVATGLSSEEFLPRFDGEETFTSPIFHSKYFPKRFWHETSIGRTITRAFWWVLTNDVVTLNQYDKHPETKKLKPWSDAFYSGTSFSILNYSTNFFDLVKSGTVKIHIADLVRLSPSTVHLSDGTSFKTELLLCATGWKHVPPLKFLPEGIEKELGLPHVPSDDEPIWRSDLVHKADSEILTRFPRLRDQPKSDGKFVPLAEAKGLSARFQGEVDPSNHTRLTPYTLYRFMVPPLPKFLATRDIAFTGFATNFSTATSIYLQALWISAFFDGDIAVQEPGSDTDPEVAEKLKYNTVLYSRFGRWRYPAGRGSQLPDFVFDAVPYFDLLMGDLGLKVHRKKGWFAEATDPYGPADYADILSEWVAKRGTRPCGC